MTLDDHLKACVVGNIAAQRIGMDDFATALASDPKLMAAAEARLAGLTDDMGKRCWITRRTRQHLEQAIGAARG